MTTPTVLTLALALTLALPPTARAQAVVVGTFHWQMQPFCSTLSLTVIQEAGLYRLQGTETCAQDTSPRSVHGSAALDGQGRVLLTIDTPILQYSLEGTTIYAYLDLATLAGSWRDDGGRSGPLTPVAGPVAGTNPRGSTGNAFLHVVNAQNRTNNITCFSHPLTDGRSSAWIQVTVNRGQASTIRPAVPSTFSVYLDNDGTGLPSPLNTQVWCISRDDNQPIPLGAAFNIRVTFD